MLKNATSSQKLRLYWEIIKKGSDANFKVEAMDITENGRFIPRTNESETRIQCHTHTCRMISIINERNPFKAKLMLH